MVHHVYLTDHPWEGERGRLVGGSSTNGAVATNGAAAIIGDAGTLSQLMPAPSVSASEGFSFSSGPDMVLKVIVTFYIKG